ncbi:MAG TPA: class F sortase [Propionibacterium sp.]|jgi:hypothetical protein|nr:class F sortase [Propionibacterium sp.]
MFKNRAALAVLGVLVAVILIVGAVLLLRPQEETSVDALPPADTAAPVETGAAPDGLPAESPANDSCTNFTGYMDAPARFEVERMGVDSPMIVVGKDADGNPGSPPLNAPYTTAWYTGSPEPGTTQGNVILSIHTYSQGQALGNDLYGKQGLQEGTGGLEEGDLIKISDANGNEVCYRYTGLTKVWVDTYDPASGVFFNPDGPPQLAIMICWDYVPATKDWDSRIIFYAELIPEGQTV